ncbi:GTPase-activating protein CIN2 NDAI_0F01310 [Naumovozyma dairenensis CBS 421]|uniref:C-CAP/cofactor C-like domain-containing protein n=1 Tax=Naumovozyma dairenensis (strain ATCC 10597 / BCRC 20456 / CBS 421 / NBRC 0211 / NRRL Y-12639) TaxID=1071378 RepID=G0WCD9_NAUDC|nr:hypothetical protein NDAI_0F01310 [Naumovozyma dairenensis CBS 421]CCD25450.1 hypothetical protein NDAI_0F01310 [Naumovozyma dairenensis CBS 421]
MGTTGSNDLLSFRTRLEKLQEILEDEDKNLDYNDIYLNAIELNKIFNEISNDLPTYDMERYSSQLQSLLKVINSKNISNNTSSSNSRRFKFKKTSSLRKKTAKVEEKTNNGELTSVDLNTSGKSIHLSVERTQAYKNLVNCIVVSGSNIIPEDENVNGSLSFHNIDNTLINLQSIPFNNGSFFISNCKNSVILLATRTNNTIQVRLHELNNCKIYIQSAISGREGENKDQNVILENCSGIIFHERSKPYLEIQDFTNLNLNGSYTSNECYRFDDFDFFCNDSQSLTKKYISYNPQN